MPGSEGRDAAAVPRPSSLPFRPTWETSQPSSVAFLQDHSLSSKASEFFLRGLSTVSLTHT